MAWLKVKPAAEHFGLSERTFRDLLKAGFPHSRLPSGTILIEREAGDEWLRQFDVDSQANTIVNDILEGFK